jgi:hypothetical protein
MGQLYFAASGGLRRTEDSSGLVGCFGSCQDFSNSGLVLFSSEFNLHEFTQVEWTY